MRYIFRFLCLCTLGVLPLIGCGDNNGGGGSGGTGGANITPITFHVTGWTSNGALEALEGVDFCQIGEDYCVMSDGDGLVTLLVPTGEEVAFTAVKEGYLKYLSGGVAPQEPVQLDFGMASEERAAYLHDLVMSPYPMEGTGDVLIVNIDGGAFPGATLELVDAAGKGFYYNAQGDWDPDLTATTSYPLGPWGGFTEVSPGEVEITWGGTAEGCAVFKGWPSDKANTMRLPVMAGFVSLQDVACAGQ